MSSPNLAGAFATTLNGRKCTAVPRNISAAASSQKSTSTSKSTSKSTSTSTSRSTSKSTLKSSSSSSSFSSSSSSAKATTTAETTPTSTSTPAPQTTPNVSTPSATPTSAPTTTSSSSNTGNGLAIISATSTSSSTVVALPDLASTTTSSAEPQVSSASDKTDLDHDSAESVTSTQFTTSTRPDGQKTTIGITNSVTSARPAASIDSDTSRNGSNSASSASSNNMPVGVIVGSVLGGLFFVILIALLLWWWRKRTLKKRRSTLLTPLDLDPKALNSAARPSEKSASAGPTPRSARFKTAIVNNVNRFRSQFSPTTPNPNRISRLERPNPPMSHKQAVLVGTMAAKDRAKDWAKSIMTSMASRMSVNEISSSKSVNTRNLTTTATTTTESKTGNNPPSTSLGSKPDFLTYLGMDSNDVQREAQRRQANHSASNSASSTDQLLGNIRYGSDSFDDTNVLSARPNPFTDINEVGSPINTREPSFLPPSSSYAAALRANRGRSPVPAPGSPSTESNMRSSYGSFNSSNSRSKFRSDPFDLDASLAGLSAAPAPPMPRFALVRPDSKISIHSNSTTTSARSPKMLKTPVGARLRGDSMSSKWSSGVSLGDWSDPGPDVGPSGLAYDVEPVPPIPSTFKS